MDAATKKKLTLALTVIAIAIAMTTGIMRGVGCEKGEAVTDEIGDALDNVRDSVPGLAPDGGTGGVDGTGGIGGATID